MLKFTLPDKNDFIVKCTMDGTTYRLHFSWNERGQYWSFEILDVQKNTLMGMVKCVPNYLVLSQFRTPDLPPGEIVFLHYDSKAAIGRTDFVTGKAEFLYLTAAEVAVLGTV